MIQLASIAPLRRLLGEWRSKDEKIVLVPTMGNLHEGHLELVRQAIHLGDRVIVSIFVNPMQFGEGEDLDTYPRTLGEDAKLLADAGVDLLFAPSEDEIYPNSAAGLTRVHVPEISSILCGISRPAHFAGVTTVVCKLFNMVQPDLAVFGEKDFQQLKVIRRMTEDLNIPVAIIGIATFRENDGLAMSSRNRYLTESQRIIAPNLYRVLGETRDRLGQGERDFSLLEKQAFAELEALGFVTEYFEIRRADDLDRATDQDQDLVILAAARLGRTRLIDNISFLR